MDPDEIVLETMSKSFEYEKHSRFIDELNGHELRNFAKVFCKMYLKQQEVLSKIDSIV
jgi:hypothetical protein